MSDLLEAVTLAVIRLLKDHDYTGEEVREAYDKWLQEDNADRR